MKRIALIMTMLFAVLMFLTSLCHSQDIDITYEGSGLWSYINRMVVDGDYAFCAMNHGLLIVDIGDPANPEIVSRYYLDRGVGNDIAFSGQYAYFCGGSGDLRILDISDISSPVLVDSIIINGNAEHVYLGGNIAIIAGSSGFEIFDITDPVVPVRLGGYDDFFFGNPSDIFVRQDYLIVSSYAGLKMFDISDPSMPTLDTNYVTERTTRGMAIQDDTLAYIVTDTAFHIINIVSPLTPVLVGSGECQGRDIEVIGDYAVIGEASNDGINEGLHIYDISNPALPVFAGYIEQTTFRLAVAGDYICASDLATFFNIVDIADPAEPVVLGTFETPYGHSWGMRNVVTDGRHAYIAYGYGGLVIADISDPANPVIVSDDLLPLRTTNVRLIDRTLYVTVDALGINGLYIIDVTDPVNPRIAGSFEYSSPQEVVIHDNYAILSGNHGDAEIVGIDYPEMPYFVSEFRLGGITWGMEAHGNYLYAANYQHYLKTIDISDIYAPVVIDSQYVTPQPYDILIYKGYLIMSLNSAIYVYDIETDPALPQRINSCNIEGDCYRMTPYGDYIFVSAGYYSGLTIVDMTNPISPQVVGTQLISGAAKGTAVFDNRAYVVDQYGMIVFNVDLPTCCINPGDANFDGTADIGDATFLINYIFREGLPVNCPQSADLNGDCIIDIGDPVCLINYLFREGQDPVCSDCVK